MPIPRNSKYRCIIYSRDSAEELEDDQHPKPLNESRKKLHNSAQQYAVEQQFLSSQRVDEKTPYESTRNHTCDGKYMKTKIKITIQFQQHCEAYRVAIRLGFRHWGLNGFKIVK